MNDRLCFCLRHGAAPCPQCFALGRLEWHFFVRVWKVAPAGGFDHAYARIAATMPPSERGASC